MPLFKSFLVSALVSLFSLPSFGQGGIADPTTWTYEVKKTGTNRYELIFHVELTDGWHIFSQKPGDEFLIPPGFEFKLANGAKLVGKVVEKGMLKTEKMDGVDNPVRYYEKKVDFVQTIMGKAGTVINGEQEYQVCNDRMCLPPKTKSFQFVLKD